MNTMGDGLRTIHIVTTDESIVAQTRAACASLEGAAEAPAAGPAVAAVVRLKSRSGGGAIGRGC